MSPVITPAQSVREAHALMAAMDAAAKRRDWPAVVDACRKALAHPCADHAFYVRDVWTGLAEAYAQQKNYDDAITALESAVAAGHRSWPHPDADLARLHLLAGRREPADALFASLRERTPNDVWFRQAAGMAYAGVEDHDTAAAWFAEGLELAMQEGDLEGLVGEMDEARTASLGRLGHGPDELSARAQTFAEQWVKPEPGAWSPPDWPSDLPPVETQAQACAHCGWRPVRSEPSDEPGEGIPPQVHVPVGKRMPMGVAWFTRDDWPAAVARWPDLLEEMPADHADYVREIQARVLRISEATGGRLIMVPISVSGLLEYCTRTEATMDPGSGRARADYAAALLQEGHGRPWPPQRNEACWCGSGRKYKLCCGAVQLPIPQ